MAPLQASAVNAQDQRDALGTTLESFVPALSDSKLPAGSGGDTEAEPAYQQVVAGANSSGNSSGKASAGNPGAAEPSPATSTDEAAVA